MAIDVEVSDVAVEALADEVGQPADGKDVGGTVEDQTVGEVEALTGEDLGGDRLEPRVMGAKRRRRRGRPRLRWAYRDDTEFAVLG